MPACLAAYACMGFTVTSMEQRLELLGRHIEAVSKQSRELHALRVAAKQRQNADPAALAAAVAEHTAKEKQWAERERDLKTLIDTYKSSSKDIRDLVEVRFAERKLIKVRGGQCCGCLRCCRRRRRWRRRWRSCVRGRWQRP